MGTCNCNGPHGVQPVGLLHTTGDTCSDHATGLHESWAHTVHKNDCVNYSASYERNSTKKKKKKRDDQFKSSEKTAIVYFTGPGMPQRRHFISSAKSSFRAKAKEQAVPYVAQNVCSRGSDCRGWQNYQFLLYFSVYLPSGLANFKITPAAIPETTELTAQALVLGMSLTIPASMFHERKLCIVWCGLWCCTWIFRWWYSMVTNEWTVVCLPGIFRVWVQSTYDRAHYDTRFCNESVVWRIMFILEGNLQRSTNSALCLVHALQKRIV